MSDVIMNEHQISWFVSDVHCRRAIGYLGAELASKGYLRKDVEFPHLLELWGDALSQTMAMDEPSPLGPDPEAARKFLLTTIEARITRLEDRGDRVEQAIMKIGKWMLNNMTRFGHRESQEIERILYGFETTSEQRTDSAR